MQKKNNFLKKWKKFKNIKKKTEAKKLRKKLQIKRKTNRIKNYEILRIKCCSNNTIVGFLLRNGTTKKMISCGSLGFKKAQKTKPPAMVKLINTTLRYLKYFKTKRIVCIITGHHGGLRKFLKKIKKKITIVRLIYKLNLPHNGCRAKKKRRK